MLWAPCDCRDATLPLEEVPPNRLMSPVVFIVCVVEEFVFSISASAPSALPPLTVMQPDCDPVPAMMVWLPCIRDSPRADASPTIISLRVDAPVTFISWVVVE